MNTVETVRGPVPADRLGPTLAHEHVFVMQPEALQNYGHLWGPGYWDEEVRVADAIQKLTALRAAAQLSFSPWMKAPASGWPVQAVTPPSTGRQTPVM